MTALCAALNGIKLAPAVREGDQTVSSANTGT
jgi:hypothetical protein